MPTSSEKVSTAEKPKATAPTGSPAAHRPRAPRHGWRRVLEVVVIIALIIGANVLITLGFELYSSLANVMWDEYRAAAGESIDTVIVGSSTGQRSFDPSVLDATLGTTTFNMATPAQELDDSYTAAKQAIEDHHVKRVVLALDYESISTVKWPGSHVAFARAKMAEESFPQAVADYWQLLTSSSFFDGADSICALFPWGYNHVELDAEHIATNFNDRVSGTAPVQAAERVMDGWTYYGNGYGNYDNVIDYSLARKDTSVAIHGLGDFKETCLDQVASIARLCRENDVQLVVVVTPRPAFNVLVYGEKYPEQMALLQQVTEQEGVAFVDANLLHAETYSPQDADFGDGEHLNHDGATRFSQAFAGVLQALDAGQDVGSLSYSYDSWNQYLASIHQISAVMSRLDVSDGGAATVTAQTYTGTDVQVEYRFLLVDKDGGTTVLQDWSSSDSCDVPRGSHGTVMVCARQAGSASDYERYCVQELPH